MQLLGSTTSPYVRRIRLFMALLNKPYEFKNLDIFSTEGREELTKRNPALKIPALIDKDECIYDSRVIFRYLSNKFSQPDLSWQQENNLTLIDAANDSLVTLLLCNRSKLDVHKDVMFFNIQHERIEKIYQILNEKVSQGEFDQWHYPEICLYCLIEWADFRDLMSLTDYPALTTFIEKHKDKSEISVTAPKE